MTERRILPNLIDYKVNKNSIYGDYDPLDVLIGRVRWSDVPRKVEGEPVSAIEFDPEENDHQYRVFKSSREPYTRKEQMKIIEEIQKRKAYSIIRGNIVWKRMEQGNFNKGKR